MGASIANLDICRICAKKCTDCHQLFSADSESSLASKINKYLPISVSNDGVYPSSVCNNCSEAVASTVDFLELVVQGQLQLKKLLQLSSLSKSNQKAEAVEQCLDHVLILKDAKETLQSFHPQQDDSNCDKLYNGSHPLTQLISGPQNPRKKHRGRSKKSQETSKTALAPEKNPSVIADSGRPKRKINMPSRFKDTVAVDDLESLLSGGPNVVTHPVIKSEPSIYIPSNAPEEVPSETPYALNIEILEQDGQIILQGIENFGEFKNMGNVQPLEELQLSKPLSVDSLKLNSDISPSRSNSSNISLPVKVTYSGLPSNNTNLTSSVSPNVLISTEPNVGINALGNYQVATSTMNYQLSIPEEYHLFSQQALSSVVTSDSDILNGMLESTNSLEAPMSTEIFSKSQTGKDNVASEEAIDVNISIADVKQITCYNEDPSFKSVLSTTTVVDAPKLLQHSLENEQYTPIPNKNYVAKGAAKKGTAKRKAKRKTRFRCNICNKNFVREARYRRHLSLHGTVHVQCVQCLHKFEKASELSAHQAQTGHVGVGIFELSHLAVGTVSTILSCRMCPSMKFSNVLEYEEHRCKEHLAIKSLQCEFCDKKFTYENNLQAHIEQVHSDQQNSSTGIENCSEPVSSRRPNMHSCPECKKTFNHISSLGYHLDSVHSKGRVYVCVLCGASFKHKLLLQRHYAVHSDNRPHECEICLKRFKTRCNLSNHMVTHSRGKKYTCEECGKQFNHVTSMTLHRRFHSGIKPFKCPHCEKSFTQNGNLQEHIRTHTGDKPFMCTICSKRFRTSSQVRTHLPTHIKKERVKSTSKHTKIVDAIKVKPVTLPKVCVPESSIGVLDPSADMSVDASFSLPVTSVGVDSNTILLTGTSAPPTFTPTYTVFCDNLTSEPVQVENICYETRNVHDGSVSHEISDISDAVVAPEQLQHSAASLWQGVDSIYVLSDDGSEQTLSLQPYIHNATYNQIQHQNDVQIVDALQSSANIEYENIPSTSGVSAGTAIVVAGPSVSNIPTSVLSSAVDSAWSRQQQVLRNFTSTQLTQDQPEQMDGEMQLYAVSEEDRLLGSFTASNTGDVLTSSNPSNCSGPVQTVQCKVSERDTSAVISLHLDDEAATKLMAQL